MRNKNLPESTYLLHRFSSREEELRRLKKQGSLLPELELRFLIRHGLNPGMEVLDAACGPGLTSCLIDAYLDTGKVVGADLDPFLLQEAKKRSEEEGRAIEFVLADVYDLPFEGRFDYIYCRFLFQHLVKPELALKSLYKALRPGGILHILDVNDEWLFLYPEVPAFEQLRRLAIAHQGLKGGNRLVGKSLRHLLAKSGFEAVEVDLIPVHSDAIGIETFIQITTQFKKEQIDPGTTPSPDQLLKEIHRAIQEEDTFGMVGVFSVSGIKPSDSNQHDSASYGTSITHTSNSGP